ncbi:carbohydrate binding family 9 domain-containing protein [Candidatus Poribacteria bacterium]|nr:carbohydrate binding family 9 domain-containing protein [Candidatus Poribacteria bacterium]MBT5531541.1 carbohydrate binding family 9 domain-containing protein [Candidatus Poribacteria bacterium]MBT5712059.1 carbohydrate binding family 9 domain-containing protein [Candidatus Poribacteria bacterium]MBT7803967.1 carbohydrate binding family 9 domain-containing protein [Candidatus Poribacteria bacterium]
MTSRSIAAPCLMAVVFLLNVTALASPKTIRARRVTDAIEIDGRFDETSWSATQGVEDFVQQEPNEGEPISDPTRVRVMYDDENLYIGFECWDAEPDRIVANEMRRDGALWQNDNVYITLDTYGAKREGYFFRTNPLGAQEDMAIAKDGDDLNGDWDCIWETGAYIHDEGWNVEIAIPFSQLRFLEADEMTWGVNFGRNISRLNGAAQWVPVPRSEYHMGTFRPTYTAPLTGIRGIRASSHLDVKPYIVGGGSEEFDEDTLTWGDAFERDIGLDVKYGVTTNLTLDVTLNTDFAQVESDREEVNLTRFDLFFPEKREFFLEGSGMFSFGAGGDYEPDMALFYSRRIGVEEETLVPVLAGTKLTGKMGSYSLGALTVLTDKTDLSPRKSYSVLRVQRDILRRSQMGAIVTNQELLGDGDGYFRNGGVDVTLRPTDQWRVDALVAGSATPDADESGLAFYAANNWRNDNFRVSASYLDIAPDFTAETGFVRRDNMRRLHVDAGAEKHGDARIRGMDVQGKGNYLVDHDNEVIGWDFGGEAGMYFSSGEGFGVGFGRSYDIVDEAFEVGDAEVLPGEYHMLGAGAGFGTNESRPLSLFSQVQYGEFFGGTRVGVDADVRWRATHQLAVEWRYGHNRIDLPDESTTTNVLGTRVSYSLNTRFFTKLFAQYNDTSDRAGVNFLLNYIYRPGSDFYLVYDQSWDTSDGLHARSWAILSKLTVLRSY